MMLKWMWPTRVFAVCAFTCTYTMMKYVLNEIWMILDEIGANERALHRYIKPPFVKFLFRVHIKAILMKVFFCSIRANWHTHTESNKHTYACTAKIWGKRTISKFYINVSSSMKASIPYISASPLTQLYIKLHLNATKASNIYLLFYQ